MERLNTVSDDVGSDIISDSLVGTPHSLSYDEGHEDGTSSLENPVGLDESDSLTDYSFDYDDYFDFGDDDDYDGDSSPEAELEPDFKLDVGETLDPTADLDEEIHRVLKREKSPTQPLNSIKTEP